MHADVAVMGAGGITLEGITNSHALLIEIQAAMMRAAQRVIYCLDHTKFGRRSMGFVCELSRVHAVVTDTRAPSDLVTQLRERQVEVVVAESVATR
jgi:DeoR/GlpR family transcriptional regulator of sugar metabolism